MVIYLKYLSTRFARTRTRIQKTQMLLRSSNAFSRPTNLLRPAWRGPIFPRVVSTPFTQKTSTTFMTNTRTPKTMITIIRMIVTQALIHVIICLVISRITGMSFRRFGASYPLMSNSFSSEATDRGYDHWGCSRRRFFLFPCEDI